MNNKIEVDLRTVIDFLQASGYKPELRLEDGIPTIKYMKNGAGRDVVTALQKELRKLTFEYEL